MKLLASTHRRRQGQRGFLVIALLAIISIMLVYVAASLQVLAALKRDIRLVEQKQVQRLLKTYPTGATTNAAPAAIPSTGTTP
jgi:hypothetical protein